MWGSKAPLLLLFLVMSTAFRGSETVPTHNRNRALSGGQPESGDTPFLPAFLDGAPEDEQAHIYSSRVRPAPHVARGRGLHKATTGVPASFTIQLVGEDERTPPGKGKPDEAGDHGYPPADWRPTNSSRFIYVWIASRDQIFIAEVTDRGGDRGDGGGETTILTATYTSDFPGDYLVHVEEVLAAEHGRGEGRPIVGSPFSLTITTDDSDGKSPAAPTLDVDSLPVCGSPEDAAKDVADTFWRPGTWLSSNVASPAHGVLRDGWVFQPKTCVYDTFSHDDLVRLSALKDEPTWILILGGSVQRGIFLTLVDMVLAKGQKDDLGRSAVQKCWGYADLQVGNIRLTYQDMRLYRILRVQDSVVCNNEKLVSGSTREFVRSTEQFLNSTVFGGGDGQGPSVVLAPPNLIGKTSPNSPFWATAPKFSVEVIMNALPPGWRGKVLFAEHMDGFECRWTERNPTRTALEDVGIAHEDREPLENDALGEIEYYQSLDPRVTFLSMFPMYQAKLFENQNTVAGRRRYGGSVHFHYISKNVSSPETHGGARMVQSTMTEMIANILIAKVVGTKAALYERMAAAASIGTSRPSEAGEETFKLCWDCPSALFPVHVKAIPEPTCENLTSLPATDSAGVVWDEDVCPDWCMEQKPVARAITESNVVDVRECRIDIAPPIGERAGIRPGDSP
ncbi:unnamed protein product [Scytosiphon promiscuus]